MRSRVRIAGALCTLLIACSFGGCFGADDSVNFDEALVVDAHQLAGGFFGNITLHALAPMSVLVPMILLDPVSGLAQNGTVLDLEEGSIVVINVLAPPRTLEVPLLIADHGTTVFPIREVNETWAGWIARGGPSSSSSPRVMAIEANGSLRALKSTSLESGEIFTKSLPIHRPQHDGLGVSEGGRHAMGLVSGRDTYDLLHHITNAQVSLDPVDGARGYLDRWAGQGNPAYEDAAQFIISELDSYGLTVSVHRYAFSDLNENQNPEAYNICGTRTGISHPNEWLVFGAHFDIAPPANGVLLDPHFTGERTYGTRVGAYDNTAGTSMVLTVAKALSGFETRRSILFCLWSGEEGGKRGSDHWTALHVAEDNPEVEVVNYINLDMAGVNWPGGGGAPHGDPNPEVDDDGYPKDSDVWPLRVYIGPSENWDEVDQSGLVGLSTWIGTDDLGLSEEISILVGGGDGQTEETWKTSSWMDAGKPEVIVYEDTTARSDHASFQDNLGTATLGFGGLVDGYWCYHQTCDTLDEMESWMDTTNKNYGDPQTGVSNLCDSLDVITWWAALSLFHLDESPRMNEIS